MSKLPLTSVCDKSLLMVIAVPSGSSKVKLDIMIGDPGSSSQGIGLVL